MIKRTLIITMALCLFLFLGTGIAGAEMKYFPDGLDYYGIKSWTGASTTPSYEYWDSGKFVDPELTGLINPEDCEDWVYNAAYDEWGYWQVDYEFYLENDQIPGKVEHVYFYAEWAASQEKFDPDYLETEIYDLPKLEGKEVANILLDNDSDGNYDALYLEYFIPYQPKGEFITIYEWANDTSEDPWHIEYAEMGSKCVPIPGAVYLLGSGLLGLIGMRRRLKAILWGNTF